MIGETPGDRERLVDLYLDGQLDASQRETLEQRIAQEPTLRAEIDAQSTVDESLRRLFPVPTADRVLARVHGHTIAGAAVAKPGARSGGASRGFALVAAVVIGALGIWRIASFLNPEPPPGSERYRWRDLQTVYYDEIDAGFNPHWVCKSDEEFASTFRDRFRQGLLLDSVPEYVTPIGLTYCNSLSEQTVYLLARVRGKPVIAFVDNAENEKATRLPSSASLHLYRREVGRLTVYELSPLDQPFLLEHFYDPDAPR